MNELFVNIKVDREERPDIDAIYMGALHALGEQGGWPLTMFLDSDARPVLGRHVLSRRSTAIGRPAFVDVLRRDRRRCSASEPEQGRRERRGSDRRVCRARAERLAARRDRRPPAAGSRPRAWCRPSIRCTAACRARRSFRSGASSGCCGAAASATTTTAARDAVDHARCANICQGGIYDHLGGGFARYSVDERWLVPHFEKMLYDNALLIDLLTEVWRETQIAAVQGAHRRDGRLARARDDRRGRRLRRLARCRLAKARKASSTSGRADEIAARARRRGRGAFSPTSTTSPPTATSKATPSSTGCDSLALRSDAEEQRLAGMRAKLLARARQARAPRLGRQGARRLERADDRRARARRVVFDEPRVAASSRERAFDFVATRMTTDGRLLHA